jgi:RsmE family RNA methyltransferase
LLKPENIREQLLLGLEQGIATRLPLVTVHDRFQRFIEDDFRPIADEYDARLLADTTADLSIAAAGLEYSLQESSRVVFAVGPEGGWQQHELEMFSGAGFVAVEMGERILRVETAVCALLAQLDMLRKLGQRDT